MIKLIISDLDGTLLNYGESEVNENLISIIKNLKKKNIEFAVASGRTYGELRRILGNLEDIYYVCCDGGAIIYNEEVLYKREIDAFAIRRLYNVKNIVYHSPEMSYFVCADEDLKKKLFDNYGNKVKKTEKFEDLKEIVKISKYGASFAELPPFCCEVYKDKEWCDWISNNSGKGKATEFLQRHLNIEMKETAAFGDNFNDIGMIARASFKYVMKNAPEKVKMITCKRVENIETEILKLSDMK